jgi:hypothetical protein
MFFSFRFHQISNGKFDGLKQAVDSEDGEVPDDDLLFFIENTNVLEIECGDEKKSDNKDGGTNSQPGKKL